ncbi:MAG: hypothetical protein JW939_06225 [Candidatus Thermoplasmatota archaeon]|nr:hypothetical protein [Candidatus Thermoplasmatota archaeon]
MALLFAFLLVLFIPAGDSASADVVFEPPSIEGIRERMPNATLLEKDTPVEGEVHLDGWNNSFDLYRAVIPPGEDGLWLYLQGTDRDNGKIGTAYFYENLTPCKEGVEIWIDSDSYSSSALYSYDSLDNCTIYIVVYGNGVYEIGLENLNNISIWFCLAPIILFFLILYSAILLIPTIIVIVTLGSTRKRIAQRREIIRKRGSVKVETKQQDLKNYVGSRRSSVRYRLVLWSVLIASSVLCMLLMIIVFFFPVIKIGDAYFFPWFQLMFLLIVAMSVSLLLLWLESISNRPEVLLEESAPPGYPGRPKPFREILPNRAVIIAPIFLLFFFFIYGVLYADLLAGTWIILIEILILAMISMIIIPLFSYLNIEARKDRIEFYYGPRRIWERLKFQGKKIPIIDIYSITPVSVHPFRDFLIGTWWIKIGRHGEYGYLTTERTGVSIITMDGKEYVVSTRDPMRLVKFVQDRKRKIK